MINCSRLSPTTEETRSWQPNNKSTRGLPFNARTTLGRSPANLSARSIQRNKPRSASPTGTRQSLTLFHPKERSSLSLSHWDSAIAQLVPPNGTILAQPLPLGLGNLPGSSTGTQQSLSLFHRMEQSSLSLSYWDSTICQPLPLGLDNLPGSPTGTPQSLILFHPKEQSSLSLSYWDSTICQPLSLSGTRQSLSLSHWNSAIA
ncbi:hypothetical protein Adt_42071 [Abeliophyllum distichum]|uniref:Uncharacterized protein n=1 Tax=Abeliophyllum distichum TaxID=126358 RepID=A0ABD1PQM3_9LAMI